MKKIIIFLMLAILIPAVQAALQEITAENAEPGYNIPEYNERLGGDSWYDAGQQVTVTASSTLKSDGKNTYDAKNAHDFNLETAWVEGKKDQGAGESITFIFGKNFDVHANLAVTGFRIANGYVKTKKLWEANSRVKKMKMYVNGKPYAVINLNDHYGFQRVRFNAVKLSRETGTELKFEIMEVYPGNKYTDTSISQVEFSGTGIYGS